MNTAYRVTENVVLENVKIIFKNFKGEAGQFNDEGDRNFCVVLEPIMAEKMSSDGWNVKIKPPREEGDEPFHYMKVKVRFDNYPPNVNMIVGGKKVKLDADTVGILDRSYILSADMVLSPYNWEKGTQHGVAAYLKTLYATIQTDPLDEKYNSDADDSDLPF